MVQLAEMTRVWLDAISRWFYLPECLLCCGHRLARGQAVCQSCWRGLSPATSFTSEPLWLHRETTEPIYVSRFIAAIKFDDRFQKIIHELKYNHRSGIANEMVTHIADSLNKILSQVNYDLIVPVPLHRRRKRERGYNQSLLLAREISAHVNRPVRSDLVKRQANTQSQTQLSARDRLLNVSGAFTANRGHNLDSLSVLLVDDLLTTGATLNACAKAVRTITDGEVYALAIARA